MGDTHRPGAVHGVLLVQLRQRLHGLQLTTNLAVLDDVALRIGLKDGLDLQQRARYLRRSADAAAPAQILQVVHHEELAHPPAIFLSLPDDFICRTALLQHFGCLQHHEALSQRSAAGIQYPDHAVGVFAPQLLRHKLSAPAGAADAAGDGDVQYVIPLLEGALHGVPNQSRAHQRGLDLGTLPHGLVVVVAHQLRGLAVQQIRQGHGGDVILFQQVGRDVGRRIGENSQHSFLLLLIPVSAASPPVCRTAAHSRAWSNGYRLRR